MSNEQVADVDQESAARALDAADGAIRTGVVIAPGMDRMGAGTMLAGADEAFAAILDRLRAERPVP